MFLKAMETYWLQVVKIVAWRYLTNERRRSSKLLPFIKVKLSDLINEIISNGWIICLLDQVSCVRWNPSGDMIASASDDKTVVLLDFKAGKKLYTGQTSDHGNLLLFNQSKLFLSFLDYVRSVCFIWEKANNLLDHHVKRRLQRNIERINMMITISFECFKKDLLKISLIYVVTKR